ncbi:hypothetical protein M440DRAFT_1391879 [Trichoderma longibrachiatum ATCC 18648]|uniref:RRM domain-containing protein n=1 Tax=Trichoderma longibrachiatum ATCC 18648 TaxID=983965 RepID=A0A2T4C471_TRILO|nr:hypothetical protein M440DRAFT_1391879 [Trichoderma longibrachiatum ATCC 18648]
MDHRVRDRLINLTPPASKAASPTTGSQHGRDAALIQLEDEPATPSDPGLQGVSSDPSLNAAPEEGNVSDQDNAAKSEAGEVHRNQKKQAKHLEKLQEIQDALWQGLHQLQYIVFEANELEESIEGLPKDGLNDSLFLAIRTVSKSLTGVRHIVKSNIVLMEEASGTSYSSKAVEETRKTTVELATPEMSGSGSRLQATRDYDDQEDLLLDEVSPSTEDVANTPLDAPGDQPPAAWNIASPGAADPFVDAPQARGSLSLTFHPDITSIAGYLQPKLWVVGLPSRRVILKNLPPDMTLAHISRGIRSQGGLISIQRLNTAPIFNNHTTTVMLEFFNPRSAADFTKAAGSSPLMYETKHGHQYRAEAWLIPTPSYYISQTNKACIFSKSTRAMMFKGFPKQCIWFFLYIIGLTKVVRADYDPINDSLTVEFTTIFEAGRVDRLIWTGIFSDFYQYDEGNGQFKISLDDPTDVYESKYGPQTLENPVKHHLDDDLDAKWNCYPYNDYLPPSLRDTAPACPTRLPLRTRIALQREIDETEVDGYLDDLENHEDTDYHIVGTSATIKRRKHGFSISNEDENKLLLANTLHDPDWADYWDEHYKCRGEINRRRYEHYGAVARHRREVAAEQGLGEEAVPGCCSRGCEMGCRDMKETPAAPVIREFLSAVNSSTIKKGRGK